MSTRISLVYLSRPDGSTYHIYQEAFTDQIWVEDIRPLCTADEWNATEKDQARDE